MVSLHMAYSPCGSRPPLGFHTYEDTPPLFLSPIHNFWLYLDHLGYEPYEAKGRNSGNSRNGYYSKKVRTSEGETDVRVPRDRNSEYEPKILRRYASNTNELEEKIIGLYAKGKSTRDIKDTLHELYGV